MSLAARVTALAQAIGADIKDLRTKVGSTIVASAHNSPVAPTVVAINVPHGAWAVLPLPTALSPTSSDGVNPDFTRNADGSITFNKAGTYNIATTAGSANSPIPGSVGSTATTVDLRLVLTSANKATVHDVNDPQVAMARDLAPAGEYWIKSLAANVEVVVGQRIGAVAFAGGPTDTNLGISMFSVVRAGSGPAGPKGDVGPVGGNATVPMDTVHLVGAAGEPAFVNAWTSYGAPLGAARFRKDPLGKVRLAGAVKGGTSATIFTLPAGYRPATEVEFVIDQAHTAGIIIIQASGIVGVITLGAAFVSLEGIEFDTESVTQMPTGPQGPKGDPGGVNVLTTLDWNTALTPNFYRSSTDFLAGNTAHGPGDTLNPPPQAGIVASLDNGTLVQRVWDLQYNVGYTRYLSGGTWTAWSKEVSKPPVYKEQVISQTQPEDGDEFYFQSDAMRALGIMWKFRYNKNNTSAYKWEFVGGSELWNYAGGGGTQFTSTSPVDFPDVAERCSLTLPLAGIYDLSAQADLCQSLAPGAAYAYIVPVINGSGIGLTTYTASQTEVIVDVTNRVTVPSGAVFKNMVQVSGGGGKSVWNSLRARPVAVQF